VAFTVVVVLLHCEVLARGDLAGRVFLTYQSSTDVRKVNGFIQHWEFVLRDHLYRRSRMELSFFFDSNQNLTDDLTVRRYRLHLDVLDPFYTLNLRIAPRQKTQAVQIEQGPELTQNQLNLNLHVPKLPQMRLTYSKRDNYAGGLFLGTTRDLRGDLAYRYKWLAFRLNRWNNKTENDIVRTTTVTGGGVRADKAWGRSFSANGGYEYQMTERVTGLARTDVSNHTVNGNFAARYRDLAWADLLLVSRRLTTEGVTENKTLNDNFVGRVTLFPMRAAKLIVSRTYLLTDNDSIRTLADYATAEVVASDELFDGTSGRVHVALREDINTAGGVVPPNLYSAAVRSKIREGIDLRADVNISQRQDESDVVERYQMSSVFELYLLPRNNVLVTPSANYVKFSDKVSFRNHDRATLGLRTNWYYSTGATMGLDITQNRTHSGIARKVTSIAANMSLRMRARSALNITYGVNLADFIGDPPPDADPLRDSSTLNVQTRVWTSFRGSLTLNYTNVRREAQNNSENIAVSYRLDF
jgi:hypothetical protein